MPTTASDPRDPRDPRAPWLDRFERPTLETLRKAFSAENRPLFDAARTILASELDLKEQLHWLGLPWRWSLVYTDPATVVPEPRGFAYLVPDPTSLKLCVPLPATTLDRMPLRKLKKSVRETLIYARNAAGVWWPLWELTCESALDEVFELVRVKTEIVRARTTPQSVELASANA